MLNSIFPENLKEIYPEKLPVEKYIYSKGDEQKASWYAHYDILEEVAVINARKRTINIIKELNKAFIGSPVISVIDNLLHDYKKCYRSFGESNNQNHTEFFVRINNYHFMSEWHYDFEIRFRSDSDFGGVFWICSQKKFDCMSSKKVIDNTKIYIDKSNKDSFNYLLFKIIYKNADIINDEISDDIENKLISDNIENKVLQTI